MYSFLYRLSFCCCSALCYEQTCMERFLLVTRLSTAYNSPIFLSSEFMPHIIGIVFVITMFKPAKPLQWCVQNTTTTLDICPHLLVYKCLLSRLLIVTFSVFSQGLYSQIYNHLQSLTAKHLSQQLAN